MKKSGRERESYCSVGTARLIVHKLLKQRTKLERVSLSFFVCALLLDTCEIRRLNPGRFPFRPNFRLEIPETFRVKWKGFPAIGPLFCNFIARVNQISTKWMLQHCRYFARISTKKLKVCPKAKTILTLKQ